MENQQAGSSEHAMFNMHDRRQIAALVVLLLVFAMTFGLGAARLYYQIRKPFVPKTEISEGTKKDEFLGLIANKDLQKEQLKTIDTDGDSLSDFDELYIYRTSPYVRDTDSDEEDDKLEISKGQDPNCAQGKQCGEVVLSPKQIEESASAQGSGVIPSPGASVQQGMPDLNTITPQQIRELLTKQGVPQDALQNISDKELGEKFKKIVVKAQGEIEKSQPVGQPINLPVNQEPQNSTQQVPQQQGFDPEKLSAQEIRTLLKQQPNISENQKLQIDKLDDMTVKKMFQEAYQKTLQKKQTP